MSAEGIKMSKPCKHQGKNITLIDMELYYNKDNVYTHFQMPLFFTFKTVCIQNKT